MEVTLAPDVFDEIVDHARECLPMEACGLVVGRNGSGERFIAMKNALASEQAYEMDPAELISVLRSLRQSEESMVAIVHSHPTGAAEPSSRDIRQAYYPEAAHVIVSLENPARPEVRAFRILEGRAFEVKLRVIV